MVRMIGRSFFDMQQRVGEWADVTFGSPTHVPLIIHFDRIREEFEELAFEIEVTSPTVAEARVNPELKRKIGKEAADVYITLLRLCWLLNIDLESVTDEKQSINEKRRWNAHGDGTGHHIKS